MKLSIDTSRLIKKTNKLVYLVWKKTLSNQWWLIKAQVIPTKYLFPIFQKILLFGVLGITRDLLYGERKFWPRLHPFNVLTELLSYINYVTSHPIWLENGGGEMSVKNENFFNSWQEDLAAYIFPRTLDYKFKKNFWTMKGSIERNNLKETNRDQFWKEVMKDIVTINTKVKWKGIQQNGVGIRDKKKDKFRG